jgi:sulfate adenylyltransferase subunit 1 (EFTu-like GTPase family)
MAGLSLNEIGRIGMRITAPLFHDDYRRNRTTGSFILIEETSGEADLEREHGELPAQQALPLAART